MVETRTGSEAIQLAKEESVAIVDLKFTDVPGTMQHFSVPVSEITEDSFGEGHGFDGSSIRGFQQIQESDMMLVPDPSTAVIDALLKVPTMSMICDVFAPCTSDSR